MANSNILSFKVCLLLGGDREIRRFLSEYKAVSTFNNLKAKLTKAFSVLYNKKFFITWKDKEGDYIVISNDDELAIALNNVGSDTCRLFVSAYELNAHGDLLCDNCDEQLYGYRYKCIQCTDFNLCAYCESHGHHGDHLIMRIPYSLTENPSLSKFMTFYLDEMLGRYSKVLEMLLESSEHDILNEIEEKLDCNRNSIMQHSTSENAAAPEINFGKVVFVTKNDQKRQLSKFSKLNPSPPTDWQIINETKEEDVNSARLDSNVSSSSEESLDLESEKESHNTNKTENHHVPDKFYSLRNLLNLKVVPTSAVARPNEGRPDTTALNIPREYNAVPIDLFESVNSVSAPSANSITTSIASTSRTGSYSTSYSVTSRTQTQPSFTSGVTPSVYSKPPAMDPSARPSLQSLTSAMSYNSPRQAPYDYSAGLTPSAFGFAPDTFNGLSAAHDPLSYSHTAPSLYPTYSSDRTYDGGVSFTPIYPEPVCNRPSHFATITRPVPRASPSSAPIGGLVISSTPTVATSRVWTPTTPTRPWAPVGRSAVPSSVIWSPGSQPDVDTLQSLEQNIQDKVAAVFYNQY